MLQGFYSKGSLNPLVLESTQSMRNTSLGMLLQTYRDGTGRCIMILFESIMVRGRWHHLSWTFMWWDEIGNWCAWVCEIQNVLLSLARGGMHECSYGILKLDKRNPALYTYFVPVLTVLIAWCRHRFGRTFWKAPALWQLRRGPRGASREKFDAAPSKKQACFLEGPLPLRAKGKRDLLRSSRCF